MAAGSSKQHRELDVTHTGITFYPGGSREVENAQCLLHASIPRILLTIFVWAINHAGRRFPPSRVSNTLQLRIVLQVTDK